MTASGPVDVPFHEITPAEREFSRRRMTRPTWQAIDFHTFPVRVDRVGEPLRYDRRGRVVEATRQPGQFFAAIA